MLNANIITEHPGFNKNHQNFLRSVLLLSLLGPFTSYEENKVLPIFYVKGINHKFCFNKFFSHPTNEVTVDVRQILQNILQL
jgi:hypothetical protein